MRLRQAAAAAAFALGAGAALAHPHGGIECRAEVRLDGSRLQSLRGELLLDVPHSQQALALIADPATGALDAQKTQRFAFGLKLQMARLNWLFDLQADGRSLALLAGEPRLEREGERLRVAIDFVPAPGEAGGAAWGLVCADPSYYWVTAFGAQPSAEAAAQASPVALAVPDLAASALRLQGCARPQALVPPAGAARGGTGRIDWRCEPA